MLSPGSRIGILGGGQLGRMLALAAARLGFDCHIFCPDPDSPAFRVSAEHVIAPYDDLDALDRFARSVDVVTYEFENVDVVAAERIGRHVPVRPGARALAVSQDRLSEKKFIRDLGVSVAPFSSVNTIEDMTKAVSDIGTPAILKTRRLGYDGKGQVRINSPEECPAALEAIKGAPAILEAFVPFTREISVIVVRNVAGDVVTYDPAENVHRNHILHTSTVPAMISTKTSDLACQSAASIAAALDYVGTMGVEFFVAGSDSDEQLIVNEIAPRVHNSGHWTEDACANSQFESHIRAIADWPLASTERWSNVVMTNLIGDEAGLWRDFASEPDCHVHLYGKREARPGRKMGHVNRLSPLKAWAGVGDDNR